ncbi:restriction endonuclease subunit S [Lacticaseibacillus pantheris]
MKTAKKRVPELRFKGFDGDWEQRKLSELGILGRGKSKHRPRNDPKLFGGAYPFVQTGDVSSSGLYLNNFTQTLSEFGLAQSKLWGKGTLAITIAANVADSTILAIDAAFPDSVIGFSAKGSSVVFDKFLLDKLSSELKRTAPTGSQANLNLEILSSTSEYAPSISEQDKIANLLIQFENNIALHERKLELLKKLKQAYLQQLLPKGERKTPRLRFDGFTGDWNRRKLSELYSSACSGGTPASTNPNYYGGDIPFLGISDISDSNGDILQTTKHITRAGLENSTAKIVEVGSIALAMYASVGKVGILRIEVATSQAFYNMTFSDDNLRDFVYQTLVKFDAESEWRTLISTGTQANLNGQKVGLKTIWIAKSDDEVISIVRLLRTLDNAITLHHHKLEIFRKIKQAYLQKLFV